MILYADEYIPYIYIYGKLSTTVRFSCAVECWNRTGRECRYQIFIGYPKNFCAVNFILKLYSVFQRISYTVTSEHVKVKFEGYLKTRTAMRKRANIVYECNQINRHPFTFRAPSIQFTRISFNTPCVAFSLLSYWVCVLIWARHTIPTFSNGNWSTYT